MNARQGYRSFFAAVLLFAGIGTTQAADHSDGWQFRLTPYLWLPTIDGITSYQPPPGGGGSPSFDVGPADWLELLNYGLLIGGSARNGRFSISSDFVYLSMTSKNDGRLVSVGDTVTTPGMRVEIPVSASLNVNTRTDLDGLLFTLTAGYAVSETETSLIDLFVGARYFDVDISTSWDLTTDITVGGIGVILPSQGSIDATEELWDGIVGVRGHFDIGEGNWSVPYNFDIGTGASDQTINLIAGLAYEFDWGDLLIAYRHLEYDQGSDDLLQNFSFSGPAVGARFRF